VRVTVEHGVQLAVEGKVAAAWRPTYVATLRVRVGVRVGVRVRVRVRVRG